MYINKIDVNTSKAQTQHPVFMAKINLKSSGIANYCNYLKSCKDAPKGHFSSNRNIELFSKICKAFENHPSDEIINAEIKYRNGELFNARGMLETRRGKIIDIEPSRSDDGTGPIEYIFRKLLKPDNKSVFNNLLGKEHSYIYPKWWNENIKPIWAEISDLYKIDNTIIDNLPEEKYDKLFRAQFRKKYFSPNKENSTTNESFLKRFKQTWKVIKGN